MKNSLGQVIQGRSRFTEHLIRLNNLVFRKWVFEPGMFFLSESKWWGDRGYRSHQHNGIDLLFYEDDRGTVEALSEHVKIPLMFDGKVVRVIPDFLGNTIFAAHEIFDCSKRLFSIYGHVQQTVDPLYGSVLIEGTAVANLAHSKNRNIPSHLHLSLAFISETISLESLTWEFLDEAGNVIFLDPRAFI